MSRWPEGGAGRMFHLVERLADQLLEAGRLPGLDAVVPTAGGAAPRRIVLCGMGGSAVAGDLAAPLTGGTELVVHRDYGLPDWAGADDMVIASSYSGGTEETLSSWEEAGRRACRRLALTSGGSLAELAAACGVATVRLPGGLPPRAALGYGAGALVHMLGRLGVVADAPAAVTAAAAELRSRAPGRLAPYARAGEAAVGAGDATSARRTAELLNGRLAVIYTAGREAHGAGLRLRAQLNENAKVPAMWTQFPELDHNDLVGWTSGPAGRDGFVLLILRGSGDDGRLDRRIEVTRRLLEPEFASIVEIRASGPGPFARTMSLVQYGDFVSCHLADLRGVDPVPVDRITRLKEALAVAPDAGRDGGSGRGENP